MPGAQSPGRGRDPGYAEIANRLFLSARWIVPVEPAGAVLEHHAVAVRDGLIQAVVPAQAGTQFADYERVDLPDHVLVPGLVNAHTRAALALMRGFPDERRAAAEKRVLSADFVRDGTALACAEMLRGGITCFADRYFFPEAVLEAAQDVGIRVVLGLSVQDEPTAYASDSDDYLRKGLAFRDRASDQPFCFAPHSVSDQTLKRIGTLAAELDLPILTEEPVERLARLGLLGPGLVALRAEARDVAILTRHGCSVVNGPSAMPNIALGTGDAARRLDLFAVMRSTGLPAHPALRAATLGGAYALGRGTRIGSIEAGKRADLVAVALPGPCYDPVALLVHAADRQHVTHVWVDGERKDLDRRLENRAQVWQNALESHADS
jgi:5-methylthioadenosine/S-adenosylhomocysteine deaminase